MTKYQTLNRLIEAEIRLCEIRASLSHLRDGIASVEAMLIKLREDIEKEGTNDGRDKQR